MPIIISNNKNSVIVSEKITSVHKEFVDGTDTLTKNIIINYDNGMSQKIHCKTIEDLDEFFNRIVDIMKNTNYEK